MYGYIYKTTNLINNKIYVGQKKSSVFISSYHGSGIKITDAIKKHGEENFITELIDTADSKEELNEKEIYWIAKYNARDRQTGYNIAEGGVGYNGGGFKGKHHSEEVRAKISESTKKEMIKRKANGWVSFAGCDMHRPSKNKGKRKAYKDNVSKFITIDEIPKYEKDGWRVSNKKLEEKKHYTKEEIGKKISASLRGKKRKPCSEETKLKLHNINKDRPPINKGCKMMNNGSITKRVSPENINEFLNNGWTYGKLYK